MNSNQAAIVQEVVDTCLKANVNPIPVATKLAVQFEADTVDTGALASVEVALMTYGPAIAAAVQGEENRRAAAVNVPPYTFAPWSFAPASGDATARLAAISAAVEKLYESTVHMDDPAPPTP